MATCAGFARGHLDGRVVIKICAVALRERQRLLFLKIGKHAALDRIQRRNGAGQVLREGDDVNAVRPDDRSGKRFVRAQLERFLGERRRRIKIHRPGIRRERRGGVNGQTLCFRRANQIFRLGRFEGEKRIGKFVRRLARVHHGRTGHAAQSVGLELQTHVVAHSLLGRDERIVRAENNQVFNNYGVTHETPEKRWCWSGPTATLPIAPTVSTSRG